MSAPVVSGVEGRPSVLSQFALLVRFPNFGLLWTGQVVSAVGDAFYSLALIWLVQELTGSRTMMGAISAVVSATALFGLVAGALVDRWDRRLTMLYSDVLRGAVILLIPLLWYLQRMEIWHLFVVGIAMGLLSQLFNPAKQALIPKLVSPEALTGANALSQMAFTLVMAAGYALGGTLLVLMTANQLFVFDAITFAVSAITIFLIRVPKVAASMPEDRTVLPNSAALAPGEQRTLLQEIAEGLRYMRSDPLVSATIPVSILANFIFAPLTVLLAAWARDVLGTGAQGFGFMEGSFLVGILLGNLSASGIERRVRRGRLVTWGVVCLGLPVVALALLPNLYFNMAMLVLMGFVNGIVNIILISTFQRRVPDEMMGRFFGALIGFAMLATPLGIAIGGALADYIPIAYIFTFSGLAMAALGLTLFRKPAVAELE
ncbi:MAG: MFS transporter [Chloroflexi bacterium]|nr:MAG: MFS transporter [Chloroflexota bacterium]